MREQGGEPASSSLQKKQPHSLLECKSGLLAGWTRGCLGKQHPTAFRGTFPREIYFSRCYQATC